MLDMLHVGVDEREVAFAAAPEDVAEPAKAVGCVHRCFDLRRGVAEDLNIWTCARARGIARVDEKARRSPEQFLAGRLHLRFNRVNNGVEVLLALGDRCAFGGDVAVVKTEVVDTYL